MSMLWYIEIEPSPGNPDLLGKRASVEAAEAGLSGPWTIGSARGFLIEGALTRDELSRAARTVLVDPVVESFQIHSCPVAAQEREATVYVLPKPGVTDPEAE